MARYREPKRAPARFGDCLTSCTVAHLDQAAGLVQWHVSQGFDRQRHDPASVAFAVDRDPPLAVIVAGNISALNLPGLTDTGTSEPTQGDQRPYLGAFGHQQQRSHVIQPTRQRVSLVARPARGRIVVQHHLTLHLVIQAQ
jgi:hypothetical protein